MKLPHLRRFVKPKYLPTNLQTAEDGALQDSSNSDHPDDRKGDDTLFFLVCAASVFSFGEVLELLSSSIQPAPLLRTVKVPLLQPSSAEQAERWSREYWPTAYKRANPYGPHPSIITHAEHEIQHGVGYYMDLAKSAGQATESASKGMNIGAVVVDRNDPEDPKIVAVAGDARFNTIPAEVSESGNVLAHATMRVIGLVARKRQELLNQSPKGPEDEDLLTAFADEPLTEIERTIDQKPSIPAGGYLCLNLEIYLTHEPCVMCSMAILHSRFGKVVFQERMPQTGGLSAELENTSEMSYGLFWRPELNWKLLAWQWCPDDQLPSVAIASNVHA